LDTSQKRLICDTRGKLCTSQICLSVWHISKASKGILPIVYRFSPVVFPVAHASLLFSCLCLLASWLRVAVWIRLCTSHSPREGQGLQTSIRYVFMSLPSQLPSTLCHLDSCYMFSKDRIWDLGMDDKMNMLWHFGWDKTCSGRIYDGLWWKW
jgi:hypothetical protein